MSLLPTFYQKEIRREKILRLSFIFISLLCGVILVAIVFMLPSYFTLQFSKTEVLRRLDAQKQTFERQNINSFEEAVRKINQRAKMYAVNENHRHALAPLLARIANVTQKGIRLSTIDLKSGNDGSFSFALRGTASTRDVFLSYAQQLRNVPEFSSVRSPVSNLLRESNAPFEIEILIKKEAYFYVANQ